MITISPTDPNVLTYVRITPDGNGHWVEIVVRCGDVVLRERTWMPITKAVAQRDARRQLARMVAEVKS